MAKTSGGFFWGVLLGAAAAAIAGAVALTRGFRTFMYGGGSRQSPARGGEKTGPGRGKGGNAGSARRAAARK